MGAVASVRAAEIYGLDVLAEKIQVHCLMSLTAVMLHVHGFVSNISEAADTCPT